MIWYLKVMGKHEKLKFEKIYFAGFHQSLTLADLARCL